MMAAANISMRKGFITKEIVDRQEKILNKYNLPVKIKNIEIKKILDAIKMDKKNSNGKVKWVLLDSIGNAIISQEIDEKIVIESLKEVII